VPVAAAPGLGKHPTEKPCELYRWLIERYCPPDGTVLDPTFGSGNSVFTAQAMGRHAIGIEKDEKFYKKAADKLPRNTIVEQEQEQKQEQAV
jgi:site-specific DNA-methyltransferase (adenine-specific)